MVNVTARETIVWVVKLTGERISTATGGTIVQTRNTFIHILLRVLGKKTIFFGVAV